MQTVTVVTAPGRAPKANFFDDAINIFLAGSIEQGAAREWQKEVVANFKDFPWLLTFFNPRREERDIAWNQDPNNHTLVEQIRWELQHIRAADAVFFYFQAGTKSPISLLELGIVLGTEAEVVVVCEPGFWRETNVIETCAFFGVETFSTLENGIASLKEKCTTCG